jgi:translation initiation factor 2 subunit 2
MEDNSEIIISNITRDQIINNEIDKDKLYLALLNEIYDLIDEQSLENTNYNITKPKIINKHKKTFWENYKLNCEQIKCCPIHFNKYIKKETTNELSVNAENILIIRGRHDLGQITEIYKKYIKNYIQCNTCKKIQTHIIKNSETRLDILECLNEKCKTTRVVNKL